MTGRGPCSAMRLSICERNYASPLPNSVRNDMAEFCKEVRVEGVPLKQMGIPLTLEEGIELLQRVYGL